MKPFSRLRPGFFFHKVRVPEELSAQTHEPKRVSRSCYASPPSSDEGGNVYHPTTTTTVAPPNHRGLEWGKMLLIYARSPMEDRAAHGLWRAGHVASCLQASNRALACWILVTLVKGLWTRSPHGRVQAADLTPHESGPSVPRAGGVGQEASETHAEGSFNPLHRCQNPVADALCMEI